MSVEARQRITSCMVPAALLLSALVAYLFGSFPSGFLAGLARGVDLRKEGSGNVGATNAVRVLGKTWGYAVFFADFLKGFLAVKATLFLGAQLAPEFEVYVGVVGAFFAVLGHNFPVWLKFQGGKGISTSGGIMLGLFPLLVFLAGLVAWVLVFFTSRYVSLASLASAVALPVASFVMASQGACPLPLAWVSLLMCVLAFWRHRENIQRLLNGSEKRFERGKKSSTAPENRS